MSTAAVEFDFDDVLSTVKRAHSRAGVEDAEDAIQTAVVELLAKGTPLTGANVVTRARSRLLDRFKLREAGNSSLDAALESDEDSAPRELAVAEVDFDVAAQVAAVKRDPILRRIAEAAEAGAEPKIARRGVFHHAGYPVAVVEEARRLRSEEGLSFERIAEQLGIGSSTTVVRWCRRQHRVVEQAGWTREGCVQALRRYYERTGEPPLAEGLVDEPSLPCCFTLEKLFGTFNAALEAAGLPVRYRKRAWSRQSATAVLREWIDEHGRMPMHSELRTSDLPRTATLQRLFGTCSLPAIAELLADESGGGGSGGGIEPRY